MAATSDVRTKLAEEAGLAALLAQLPFPAALLSADGEQIGANSEWEITFPAGSPGHTSTPWYEQVHSSPALRDALTSGVQQVLSGALPRFAQSCGAAGRQCTILVSPCPPGALITVIEPAAPDTASGERDFQSQRMETVGRLVGGVAHDFANLLTLIAGYTDILLNRIGEKDPLRPEIDEIRKAANRGARLTAQLLGFARGHTAEPKLIDLNVLITETQRLLRPIIGEYVDLEASLAPDLAKVVADPGQMEQVIMNLILNARDAMPRGGRIRVETANGQLDEGVAREHGMSSGRCVRLTITDTGEGIDPETLERVFQPFFTTKEKGKGTGLGLSTVLTIVKQYGGDVWVRSAPGEGASFTLCLPQAPHAGETQEPGGAQHSESAGGETVLLVEDEEGVRRLLTHVLHKRGYKVLEACDGEEALRIFERHASEIHLVLTDMVMPRMTGRELGKRLQELRPGTKVIYMSGYTDDVLVRTGALGPGMSFLQKPLRPDVLAAKVREALDSPARPFSPD